MLVKPIGIVKPYFFTFGWNSPFKNHYVIINAVNWAMARESMFNHYGTAWAFQYDDVSCRPLIERFNLTPMQLGHPAPATA